MVTNAHPAHRGLSGPTLAGYLLLGTALAVLLYAFDPARPGLYPPCPFRYATGLLCPGCGTLRGLHQLLHGNLRAAFGLNPLMVLSLPPLAYAALSALWFRWRGQKPRRWAPSWLGWAVLGIVLAHGISRNLLS